ncbi:hypothetical protein ACFO9Q_17400 [Paenibacillus sp. GCM10023252]|uniref:hypothetical protein n=1 Tax=Paenibacillus sp. GCM10023252 TaxID=3252649 RepID=UPI0036079219
MAFGITRAEMKQWKERAGSGQIAFLTHYWLDPRYPGMKTVTKVGCSDLDKLSEWCKEQGLPPKYIHRRSEYPHFDLMGPKQKEVLTRLQLWDHINRFSL